MLNILFRKVGVYSLLSLFLLSPNLYAQCLDYIGLKQQAGVAVTSSSENEDIANTPSNSATINFKDDFDFSGNRIVYNLEYCDPSGLVLDLYTHVQTYQSQVVRTGNDITDQTFDYDGDSRRIDIFIGYEW